MWAGYFKSALASLRVSRWRTNLTMLGIIVGISSVVTVIGLGQGLKHQVVGEVNRLGSDVLTIRPGKLVTSQDGHSSLNLLALLSASTLTDNDVSSLKKSPALSSVVPVNFVTSSAASNDSRLDNISVIGAGPELSQMLGLDTSFGNFLDESSSHEKVAVVGRDVAAKLFGELNPTGHAIDVAGQTFIVRGVLAPVSTGLLVAAQTDFNSAVLIPYDPSKDVTGGKTNLLQILVRARAGTSADTAVAEAHKILLSSHDGTEDFTILKQHQLLNLANGLINTATTFASSIAAISLLLGGIGIMNIMLASVSERTREIGIRKAIGATNRQILMQFFAEGLVLSLAGGILGVIFALLANLVMRLYTSLHPVITAGIVLIALGVAMAIGVIFSLVPAAKAARKEPIDALRG